LKYNNNSHVASYVLEHGVLSNQPHEMQRQITLGLLVVAK
jgi:hypothetical protein